MKIKTRAVTYEQLLKLEPYKRKKPLKQWTVLRWLIYLLATVDLLRVRFRYKMIGMEKLPKDQPCLILMNHSCFIDLEMIGKIFAKRPYQIVCTLDGFVGKKLLMRLLGCIPTKKFVTDLALVQDMVYAVKKLGSSVIMYPEAGYSFDGTATALPDSLGKCLKLLNVPVVMVRSYGAFLRNPLYNNLQLRKMKVYAEVEYLLSPEEIQEKTAVELNEILNRQFSFDSFRWQQENGIRIKEKFRADGLNRVLYKCPHCLTEGQMEGRGIYLTCRKCQKRYELTEEGFMKAVEGETEISHIPAWNLWQREQVRQELLNDTYQMDIPVDIYVLLNTDGLYQIGEGRLCHTKDGFSLTGCEGKLDYRQGPTFSYSLNSDFYWYEIGDVINIGSGEMQYYCFPKNSGDIVAKARLATEELYKISMDRKRNRMKQQG